jgi:hypothetical protein
MIWLGTSAEARQVSPTHRCTGNQTEKGQPSRPDCSLRNVLERVGLNQARPSRHPPRVAREWPQLGPLLAGLGAFVETGMPMEFYQGLPLEPEELEAIRQQI